MIKRIEEVLIIMTIKDPRPLFLSLPASDACNKMDKLLDVHRHRSSINISDQV